MFEVNHCLDRHFCCDSFRPVAIVGERGYEFQETNTMMEAEQVICLIEQAIEEGFVGEKEIMGEVMTKGRGHIDPKMALTIIRADQEQRQNEQGLR